MGRLDRFLGKPMEYELVSDDGLEKENIKLHPLSLDELPLFMRALKIKAAISKKEDGSTDIDMERMSSDAVDALREIVFITLKRALPDETDAQIKQVAFSRFFSLMPVVMEINLGKFQKKAEGGAPTSFP